MLRLFQCSLNIVLGFKIFWLINHPASVRSKGYSFEIAKVVILPLSVCPELVRFSSSEHTGLLISTFLQAFPRVDYSLGVVKPSLRQRVDEDGGAWLRGLLEWDKVYIYGEVLVRGNNLE